MKMKIKTHFYPLLNFTHITQDELKEGNKYMLIQLKYIDKMYGVFPTTIIATFDGLDESWCKWKNAIQHVECINETYTFEGTKYICINDAYYYKIISKKKQIQEAMEYRALLKILRKLIDESFIY